MKEAKELVSVLMPVYNCEDYIRESINSILQQNYSNLEVIIVDDCSTDGTIKIIESFKDSRIRIHKSPHNHGPSASLNIAAKLSQGKFLAIMHGDDIAFLNRIEKQVKYLKKNKEIDIVGGQYVELSKTGHKLKESSSLPLDSQEIAYSLLFINVLCHPTVTMRKEIFKIQDLKYNEQYRLCEDYEFWTGAVLKGIKVANLKDPLILYRKHDTQASHINSMLENEVFIELRNKYRQQYFNFPVNKIEDLELNNVVNIAKEVQEKCNERAARKILQSQLIMNLHKKIKQPIVSGTFGFNEYVKLINIIGFKAFNVPIVYQLVKKALKLV